MSASFLVIVDLDDTLVVEDAAHDAAIAETLSAVGALHGQDLSEAVARVRPVARRLWADAPLTAAERRYTLRATDGLWAPITAYRRPALRRFVEGYRPAAWHAALVESGIVGPRARTMADELDRAFRARRPQSDHAVPGADGALRMLASRCRIAVLTNGPAELQRGKLARTGFANLVDAIFTSEELGVGKPDPKAYRSVLRRMRASPSAAVMIGNDMHCDVRGPEAVSVPGILLESYASGTSPWPSAVRRVLQLAARVT